MFSIMAVSYTHLEMGEVYSWLGLSVGINLSAKSPYEKREAYNCDITYSTNSEIGFDYLRDNMVVRQEDMVQRPLNFALVDEVDSVLIDEARTPLIVSGQVTSETSQLYIRADKFVKTLESVDYVIDVPTKTIGLTDSCLLYTSQKLVINTQEGTYVSRA